MEILIDKLQRDIRQSAESLNEQEARYLVDLYYQTQDFRIQTSNQARILNETDEAESHETIKLLRAKRLADGCCLFVASDR